MNSLTYHALRSIDYDVRNAERRALWAERWRSLHGSYPASVGHESLVDPRSAVLLAISGDSSPAAQRETAEILIHPALFRRLGWKRQQDERGSRTQARI